MANTDTSSLDVPTIGTLYVGTSSKDGVIATGIWESAQVLVDLLALDRSSRKLMVGKRVLELGAGTGVVGIAAAKLGASRVVITDMDDDHIIHSISRNIGLNDVRDLAFAAKMDWFSSSFDADMDEVERLLGGAPELIVATDVVYKEAHMAGLHATLRKICSRHPRCVVLSANMDRITTATKMYIDGLKESFRNKKISHEHGPDFFVYSSRFLRSARAAKPAKGADRPPGVPGDALAETTSDPTNASSIP